MFENAKVLCSSELQDETIFLEILLKQLLEKLFPLASFQKLFDSKTVETDILDLNHFIFTISN